jgi:outer membrane receptor for ferrienterochelin and colicins
MMASNYSFQQQLDSLKNNISYYHDRFNQGFYRAENQTDIQLNTAHYLVLGGGYTLQTVRTTRYREPKQQQQWHAFAQHEWQTMEKLRVISGVRYDYNSDFSARLSPKLAISYQAHSAMKITASYGAGFKAPDFRQLYLNFANNAAEGYAIYGANEFSLDRLEEQKQQGLIAAILPAAYQITRLRPEISRGLNLGFTWQPTLTLKADVNFFRNDIDNLINYIPVATNNNGTSIFSYLNINQAFTRGFELNTTFRLLPQLNITGGYQFLQTADKEILENINNNKIFGRDAVAGSARLMKVSDYGGLLNRSRHMANLKLFFEAPKNGWSSSLRFTYRSRFGVLDKDGNGFANMEEEYAKAMLQVNTTATKNIAKKWRAQFGINNLLNKTNAQFIPNQPGINFFLAVNYSINQLKK